MGLTNPKNWPWPRKVENHCSRVCLALLYSSWLVNVNSLYLSTCRSLSLEVLLEELYVCLLMCTVSGSVEKQCPILTVLPLAFQSGSAPMVICSVFYPKLKSKWHYTHLHSNDPEFFRTPQEDRIF